MNTPWTGEAEQRAGELWSLVDAVWAVEEIEIAKIRDACDDHGISCEKFIEVWSKLCDEATSSSIKQRRKSIEHQRRTEPEEWDAIKADRYYDNRPFDIKDAECVLPANHHEMMRRDQGAQGGVGQGQGVRQRGEPDALRGSYRVH